MIKSILLVVALSGCSMLPTVIDVKVPTYHPELPTPYSVCPVHLEVLEVAGRAKVALSYNDNVTAAICAKDLQRVMAEYKSIICHYRAELKEPQCIKETHER